MGADATDAVLGGRRPPVALPVVEEQRPLKTWVQSNRAIPRRFVRPLLEFTHVEASGGMVLLVAAVAALVWANLPFGETYEQFWGTEIDMAIGPLHLTESLRDFVNDGLMAIFFLVVGMEIKRELAVGELRDPRTAALPAIAAIGGMVLPAVLYLLIAGGGEAGRGWGIPMATDIAFSVGVIALLGARVPVGAKLFLLALAIVDDIGAIAVIAVFYTEELAIGWLIGAVLGLVAIRLATKIGVRWVGFYVVAGFLTWFFLLESGVHATLAGVAIGLLTPARPLYSDAEYLLRAKWIIGQYDMDSRDPRGPERVDDRALTLAHVATESVSPLARQEAAIHPWSSFLIVPLFALANAGVRFVGVDVVETMTSAVSLAVTAGLVGGKFVGIAVATFIAVRLGLGRLPRRTTWTHVLGVAALAGIGFTVSLFITGLAFSDPVIIDQAKTGIFLGSTIAGLLGYLILRRVKPPAAGTPEVAQAPAAAGVPGA